MGKTLVLAEKPSVGRDLARVLNCSKKGPGYIEGSKYIVTWALGHLVTLADPEKYDDKYKSWRIEDLPMLPPQLKLVVIGKTGKQFKSVKQQMNRKDVNEIVIATDAGREGELVARWIIEKSHINKPIKRLWISSVTDKAIKDGFRNLKSGKEYENLYASAVARAEADWFVGINATRALTCKHNAQLSCGRVQTPTLAIIAKREDEIRSFKPQTFYGITATTKNIKLTWQDQRTKDIRTFNKDKCDKIISGLKNNGAKVLKVDKAHKKSFAPRLYDLTELQRDCNKIFGFSAKETASIMQGLYERHKVLTYPRTDSRYISSDIVDTLKDRVRACSTGEYSRLTRKILNSPIKSNKSFVDNSKVSDHHAIIPTEEPVSLYDLSDRERKVYDLVVKRFLSVLYPPYEYEQITVKAEIGNEFFTVKGKTVISKGWKEIYEDHYNQNDLDESDQLIPELKVGDILDVISIKQTTGETKPPKPFTEATLLSAMENPIKYMSNQNKDLVKTLGETGGLGTVATRADIIEKLFKSFLIEKRGQDLFVTSKGKQLLKLVPNELKSPELTADWEQKLSKISRGALKKNVFINDMKKYAKLVVNDIKNSESKFKHDNISTKKCPNCGKHLLDVKTKNASMLVCQDRECNYRKTIAKVSNARCPQCHKKLELRGEGEGGQIFVCKCGYKEKLSAFKKRKKDQTSNISKREVSKYLSKQNKTDDEPGNSALADALANFKFDK